MLYSPPLALRTAAGLLISYGAWSLFTMVIGCFCGMFALDFGFVGLWLGYGVLTGRPAVTGCATALLGLSFFGLALIGGLALFFSMHFDPWTPKWVLALIWAIMAFVSAWLFVGLNSGAVDKWAHVDPQTRANCAGWFWPFAITGAMAAMTTGIVTHATNKWANDLYVVHTTFELRNAAARKPVHSIGLSTSPSISTWPRDAFAPRISYSVSVSDTVEMKLRGFAAQLVELTFESEGMEPYKYTLHRDTPEHVLLNLKPSPAKDTQSKK